MILYKITHYILCVFYPFLLIFFQENKEDIALNNKGIRRLVFIESLFLTFIILDYYYSQLAHTETRERVYKAIKLIMLGLFLLGLLYL